MMYAIIILHIKIMHSVLRLFFTGISSSLPNSDKGYKAHAYQLPDCTHAKSWSNFMHFCKKFIHTYSELRGRSLQETKKAASEAAFLSLVLRLLS